MMPSLAGLPLRILSHPALSRLCGRAAEARVPGPVLRVAIAAYVRVYGVDLAEAALPVASFRTFDQFFTRPLRPGARPVDPRADVVVSPCDARLHGFGRVPVDGRLEQIKGRTYAIEGLLGDAAAAEAFRGAHHATLYLSPGMYHRVHWPVDGRVRDVRRIPGRLYPVNALAVRHVDRLFAVNRRVVIRLDGEGFGPLALVMVGATNVGRIELAFQGPASGGDAGAPAAEAPVVAKRGDELGAFHLGSTVVLLAADPRLDWMGPDAGGLVRMGQGLWRRA
jgi:phosphatidylserine decarboxylase